MKSVRIQQPQTLTRISKGPISSARLLALHAAVISVPILLFILGAAPWWTLGIGGALVTISYLCFGRIESKRQEFWLTPLSFFFFWYSVGYGVAAVYAGSEAYSTGFLNLMGKVVEGHDLAAGYVLSLVGALALHAGFAWTRSWKGMAPEIRLNERSDFRFWIFVFVLGLASMLMPDYFSGIGAARAILQLAPFGVLLSFWSLPRQYFQMSAPVYAAYGAVGSVLLIGGAFYQGSKFVSMLSLLPILSAILVRPRWRRLLPFLIVFGALIYLFVVAPVIMGARNIKNTDSQLEKLEIAADEAFNNYKDDAFYSFQGQVEKFLYRQFESTAVGFIVSDVREHGMRYGETMQNLTYALIPRVFWPDKPTVTRGNWFTAYLGGSASEEESTTSTGMYSAGELYWNFGIAGVVLGMLLIGVMFGLLYSTVGDGPHRLVLPMILFMNIVARSVDQAAAGELLILLIYLVIVILVYRYVLTITGNKRGPHLQRTASVQR